MGYLHDAGLGSLHVITEATNGHQHNRLDLARDVHFVLPCSDGLDQNPAETSCVQNVEGIGCRNGQPPERPSRRHRADETAPFE